MSPASDLYILSFPWDGVLPAANPVVLRDVDVVGVGALRRAQIERLKQSREIILQTHSSFVPASVRAIYDEEFQRTLKWLLPQKVIAEKSWDFENQVLQNFFRIFPLTTKFLGDMASHLAKQYLVEMEWSSWLLQDHWRYFSGFVRQKFPDNLELRELVQWEWIHAWLEIQPFEAAHGEQGQLVLNPSLQLVNLTKDHGVLKRSPGLYTFVCEQNSVKISELKLDVFMAALLDLLGEDRTFTSEQLVQMALLEELESPLNEEQWRKKIEEIIASGLVLEIRG